MEAILDEREVANDRMEYLVKWEGFEQADNTWVSQEEVEEDVSGRVVLVAWHATRPRPVAAVEDVATGTTPPAEQNPPADGDNAAGAAVPVGDSGVDIEMGQPKVSAFSAFRASVRSGTKAPANGLPSVAAASRPVTG